MFEGIRDSFPGSIPIEYRVLDCFAAALEVAVSHRGVQVERSILDVVVQFHVVSSFVDPLRGGAAKVGAYRGDEPRERIHERISGEPDSVAHIERGQQRQYQVGTGLRAINGK